VKITPEMIEAARRSLGTDASDDAIRAALEAALASRAGSGTRSTIARVGFADRDDTDAAAEDGRHTEAGSLDEKAEAPPLMASARRAARINA
jgi:hypothetical protein